MGEELNSWINPISLCNRRSGAPDGAVSPEKAKQFRKNFRPYLIPSTALMLFFSVLLLIYGLSSGDNQSLIFGIITIVVLPFVFINLSKK